MSVRLRPPAQYLESMKIKISELKKVIREALADHMRLPRGPNSRDDAEDRPLEDPMKDRENVED